MAKRVISVTLNLFALCCLLFILIGCNQKDIAYVEGENFHEGDELPNLILNYQDGEAIWASKGLLKSGKNSYEFYIDGEADRYEIEINATAHDSKTDFIIVKEPNCVEDGIKGKHCYICDKNYDFQSIKALGHEYTLQIHNAGDCQTNGFTEYKCLRCEEYQLNNTGEANKHYDEHLGEHVWATYEDGTYVISETLLDISCTHDGVGYTYCINYEICNATHEIISNKLNHNFTKEIYTIGDCLNKGYTEFQCTMCNAYLIDNEKQKIRVYDDDYGEHKYTHEAHVDGNCQTKGFIEYYCIVCDGQKNNEDLTPYLLIDEDYGEHIWEVNEDGKFLIKEVITPSTCYQEGNGYVNCVYHALCGGEKEVAIDKVDHDFSIDSHTLGTCVSYGYIEHYCLFSCGEKEHDHAGNVIMEIDDYYGDHKYEKGVCIYCGALNLDKVEMTFEIGKTTRSNVIAYLCLNSEKNGIKYFDLIISGRGDTYNVTNEKDIPWYNQYVTYNDKSYRVSSLIKNVIVAEGVTSLMPAALYEAVELETAILPNSLETISQYTFYRCGILKTIEFGNKLKYIEQYAFYDCASLNINLPTTLVTIGYRSFYGCRVRYLDFTGFDKLTFIHQAFEYCGLEYVIIPSNDIMRVSSSFGGENTIVFISEDYNKNLTYEINSITYYLGYGKKFSDVIDVVDGCFIIRNASNLDIVTSYNLFYFPDNIKLHKSISGDILAYAPKDINNNRLNNVLNTIDNLVMIGDYALMNCSYITEFNIPNTTLRIGNGAFMNTMRLTSMNIFEESNLVSFGEAVFYNSNIESIYIPSSVKELGGMLFGECSNLKNIYYDAKEAYRINDEVGVINYTNKTSILGGTAVSSFILHIGSNVEVIPNYMFAGDSSWTNYKVGIEYIDFSEANSLLIIGEGAFKYNDNKKYNILDLTGTLNLKEIKDNAFSDSLYLKKIIIPTSIERVESFGNDLFINCPSVEELYLNGNINYEVKTTVGIGILDKNYIYYHGWFTNSGTSENRVKVYISNEVTSLSINLLRGYVYLNNENSYFEIIIDSLLSEEMLFGLYPNSEINKNIIIK